MQSISGQGSRSFNYQLEYVEQPLTNPVSSCPRSTRCLELSRQVSLIAPTWLTQLWCWALPLVFIRRLWVWTVYCSYWAVFEVLCPTCVGFLTKHLHSRVYGSQWKISWLHYTTVPVKQEKVPKIPQERAPEKAMELLEKLVLSFLSFLFYEESRSLSSISGHIISA